MTYCVVGAGLSGAVIARELASAGHKVTVIDERKHAAGNCHTERDPRTGVMTHVYGPHIFHTSNEKVWNYIQAFGEWVPFDHKVKAVANGSVYSLPINLLTINQFFRTTLSPREAQELISKKSIEISSPNNFEEQALHMIGAELYDAFFKGYTQKQWGTHPTELPASILKRLPLRFNYDDSYFSHKHQAIPRNGYTAIVDQILRMDGIELRLGVKFEEVSEPFEHIFYSGPLDRYFDYTFGRLEYRTLDFEILRTEGDFQGAPVINYCDATIPFTRITEHKHFSPWESHQFDQTICYREYSRRCGVVDVPYYPVRLAADETLLKKYVELALRSSGVTFVGRLGTYRYLDMDVCIAEALATSEQANSHINSQTDIPVFFTSPLSS